MDNNVNVSRQDILKAYFIASQLVVDYGPAYLPVFERMQKEVDRLKLEDELMERALAVVESRRQSEKEGD